MNDIDIIITWPDNCDYPLWRRFINTNRKYFRNVIVVMMKTNSGGFNYSKFIKETLGKICLVVDSPDIGVCADWRDVAVNHALGLSKAKRVWFTEQDFIIHDGFWQGIDKQFLEGCQVVSVYEAYRMHPCCIFADREVIEMTRKNFGIIAGISDHFSMFQEDIDNLFYEEKIQIGSIENHYEHLAGLSQNFSLISRGERPNYHPDRFKKYVKDSLASGMVLHPKFVKICQTYLENDYIR